MSDNVLHAKEHSADEALGCSTPLAVAGVIVVLFVIGTLGLNIF